MDTTAMRRPDGVASPVMATILVVEDSPADAAMTEALIDEGAPGAYQAVLVGRLEDALAELQSGSMNCVILDLGLPDRDHLEGLDDILAAAPAVAVVIVTGTDNEIVALKALRRGAQDYLVKGTYDARTLVRAVRFAMARAAARRW